MVFTPTALASRLALTSGTIVIVRLLYVGIAVGQLINEFGLRDSPSNLWPIGIIVLWALAAIPTLAGILLGKVFEAIKSRGA